MLDFSMSWRLARLLLAISLSLLLLGGIAVLRNWVVAQALANATNPPALFQSNTPSLLPAITPIWGTVIPFQQWNPDWLDATPTPAPPSGGAVRILPQR